MNLVCPHVDENHQLRIVECESEWLQDVANGAITALLVLGPIALATPSLRSVASSLHGALPVCAWPASTAI